MLAILTSTAFRNRGIFDYVRNVIHENNFKKVIIIVTAAKGKSKNKYSQGAEDDFKKMGLSDVSFFDSDIDDSAILYKADVIHVCGGNTFKLMSSLNKFGCDKALREFSLTNKLYIGVSAGASILGTSIKHLQDIGMDENGFPDDQISPLDLIPSIILPHADGQLEASMREAGYNGFWSIPNDKALIWQTQEHPITRPTQKSKKYPATLA